MMIQRTIHRQWASAFIIALVIFAGCGNAQSQKIPLKNASFEKWGKRGPNEWFIADTARKRGTIESNNSGAIEGKKTLKLSPNKKNAESGDPMGVGQIIPVGQYAGKSIRISAFLGSTGGATAVVGAHILNTNNQVLTGRDLRQQDSNGKLSLHEVELDVPKDAVRSQMILFCVAEGSSGNAFFDGLNITVVSSVDTSTSRPTGGSGPNTAKSKPVSLKNASFEGWKKRDPSDWVIADTARKRGTIEFNTAGAQDGSKTLKLSPNKKNAEPGNPVGVGQIIPMGAYAGKSIRISAFLGSTGSATAVVGAHILDSSNQVITGRELRQQDSSGTLILQEVELTIPKDAANSQMILFCTAEGSSGSALFDGLGIVVLSGTNTIQPIDSGGVLTASIRINAAQEIRRIPRSLFGTNVEWIQNGNDIWDVTRNRLRPDVISEAGKLGVSLIRFPGGVFSDHYDWRDGIGAGRRPTTLHYPDGPKSTHHFGTDEALDFARRINAELLVTVNAGTGTARDAAEWVKYVNGKGGQSPRMDRVEFWEVGNELYIRNDTSMEPDVYASKVKQFIQAMKAVDPNIKIGAIGGINQGSNNVVQYPRWTATVLDEVGNDIDFLAVHNAYAPTLLNAGKLNSEQVYMALLAAPLHVQRNLDTLSREIRERVPDKTKRPTIAITEWGPFFHIYPSNEWIDHVKTLGSAVFVADMLRVFAQSPDLEVANFFKLSEPTFMGWIGPDRNGTYIPKPAALAFQLYSKHFGNIVVDTSVSVPTYKSPNVGLIDSIKEVPLLSAVASLSKDKKTLYINVINKYLSNSIKADVNVAGVKMGTRAIVRTLSGSSVDAHTGTRLMEIPGFEWAKQVTLDPKVGFNHNSMANVQIQTREETIKVPSLTHTFPPHSVTNFEIRLR